MTEKTNLFYDSAADAARAAGVSDTTIIDQCKTGEIQGAYQSSDGWWRVPVDGMRAAGHEVTGEGAHLIGPLDGAAALTTLDRVREALTKIDRLGNDAWAVWEHDFAMYEQGRSDAYHHAHTIITEALGDAP